MTRPATPAVAYSNAAPGGTSIFTTIVLVVATVLTGMEAGIISLYANTIMPGLKNTDDRTFVGAFQAMDRAVYNPWFMGTFFGALLVIAVAVCMHFGAARRGALPWLITAFVLYLIGVITTMAVNVPLNDAIDAAGDPAHINNAAVRAAFGEATWSAWNGVRLVTTIVAFVILCIVLARPKRR